MKDTYLTIDLDYWMNSQHIGAMHKFLTKICSFDVPIIVVRHHHEIINHVNSDKSLSRVLNVDYHSDLTDMSVEHCSVSTLNEGTWVNFVRNKRDEFVWHYPSSESLAADTGFCHIDDDPFTNPDILEMTGWNRAIRKRGLPTDDELNRVRRVSICVSPDWTSSKHRNRTRESVDVLVSLGLIGIGQHTYFLEPDYKAIDHAALYNLAIVS